MIWSRQAAGTFARLAATVLVLAALQGLTARRAAAVDHWTSPTDAFTQLWDARLPVAGRRWPVNMCNDITALSQSADYPGWRDYLRDPAAGQANLNNYYHNNPGARLVIPMISVNHAALTIGIAAIARALLSTDLTATAANTMLRDDPTPPTQDPRLVVDEQWWKANLRSAHADAGRPTKPDTKGFLPHPDLGGLLAVPANCPARLRPPRYGAPTSQPPAQPPDRFETIDVLQADTVYTAAQKWHCYARRFNSAGAGGVRADLAVIGLVDVGQTEPLNSDQYDQANARGRLVFDYVSKRVYYNPDHYHRWYKTTVGTHAQFSPVGDNDTPTAAQVCSPWFEIIQ